jgi:hypothetical protein
MSPLSLFLSLGLLLAVPAFGQGLGAIRATTKVLMDGSTATTVVDPEARTAEETVRDAGGKLLRKTTFLLDENNSSIAAVHYDGKGNIRYKESYQRDGANRVIESSLSAADGRALGRRVFVYAGDKLARIEDFDAAGNMIVPKATRAARPDKKRR